MAFIFIFLDIPLTDIKTFILFPYFIALISFFLTKFDSKDFMFLNNKKRNVNIITGLIYIVIFGLYIFGFNKLDSSLELSNKIDNINNKIQELEKLLINNKK
jgi:hypothetical protein